MRKYAKAIDLLQQSPQSREQLAARDPKNSGARGEIAEACAGINDALMQRRKPRQAREYYQRAHAIEKIGAIS